eukprot:m.153902 g.153902  ORF g.153902 m.153902 type:complete len:407 (+) comp15123_c1_seq6:887-2107(+)
MVCAASREWQINVVCLKILCLSTHLLICARDGALDEWRKVSGLVTLLSTLSSRSHLARTTFLSRILKWERPAGSRAGQERSRTPEPLPLQGHKGSSLFSTPRWTAQLARKFSTCRESNHTYTYTYTLHTYIHTHSQSVLSKELGNGGLELRGDASRAEVGVEESPGDSTRSHTANALAVELHVQECLGATRMADCNESNLSASLELCPGRRGNHLTKLQQRVARGLLAGLAALDAVAKSILESLDHGGCVDGALHGDGKCAWLGALGQPGEKLLVLGQGSTLLGGGALEKVYSRVIQIHAHSIDLDPAVLVAASSPQQRHGRSTVILVGGELALELQLGSRIHMYITICKCRAAHRTHGSHSSRTGSPPKPPNILHNANLARSSTCRALSRSLNHPDTSSTSREGR